MKKKARQLSAAEIESAYGRSPSDDSHIRDIKRAVMESVRVQHFARLEAEKEFLKEQHLERLRNEAAQPKPRGPIRRTSHRERIEALKMDEAGATNREIAAYLNHTENPTKAQIKGIPTRLKGFKKAIAQRG